MSIGETCAPPVEAIRDEKRKSAASFDSIDDAILEYEYSGTNGDFYE